MGTSSVSNINIDSSSYDTRHSSYELPTPQPSLTMQSFVFVGGNGAEPATSVVLYDSELAEPSLNTSPTLVLSQSPVVPVAKSEATFTATSSKAAASTPSFTQTMMAPYISKDRAPCKRQPRQADNLADTPVISISTVPIAFSPVRSSSLMPGSTARIPAHINMHLRRRSLSVDSLQTFAIPDTTVSGDSVTDPFEVLNGLEDLSENLEERRSFEHSMDSWHSSPNGQVSWTLDGTEQSMESFNNQFRFDLDGESTAEVEKTRRHEHIRSKSKQRLESLSTEQLQPQQTDQQREILCQNSVMYLAGQLGTSSMPGSDSSSNPPSQRSSIINVNNSKDKFSTNNPSISSNPNSSRMSSSHDKYSISHIASWSPHAGQVESDIHRPSLEPPVVTATNLQETDQFLENLEKEVMALRSQEIIAPATSPVQKATPHSDSYLGQQHHPTSCTENILLVTNCSSPTQFYDAPQTRHALRTFLAECRFDEVVEYGFPSEVFDDATAAAILEVQGLPEQQMDGDGGERLPNCRYMTLRTTLTPWHARADEVKLYGTTSTPGKQMQFKTIVNRFFSRAPAVTTPSRSPPAQSSSQWPRPALAFRSSSDQYVATVRSDLSSERGVRSAISSESISAQSVTYGSQSLPASRASSRTTSRVSSLHRDRSKPLPLSSQSPSARAASRAASAETATSCNRLLSPASMQPLSPLPGYSHLQAQFPRKASLTTLSSPSKDDNDSSEDFYQAVSHDNAMMPHPRRKGSSSAIFTPPDSDQSLSEHEKLTEEYPNVKQRRLLLKPSGSAVKKSTSNASTFSSNSSNSRSIRGGESDEGSHQGHHAAATLRRTLRSLYDTTPTTVVQSFVDHAEDIHITTNPRLSPSSPSLTPRHLYMTQQQEKRRSARYPYQLHTLHQEQVHQQFLLQRQPGSLKSNTLRSPWSPVTPVSTVPPSLPLQCPIPEVPRTPTSPLIGVIEAVATDRLYDDCYQTASPACRQGPRVFQFSPQRDKKRVVSISREVEELGASLLGSGPIPPRLNTKSWRRSAQRGSLQCIDDETPVEAAIVVAAAAAAAATLDDERSTCAPFEYRYHQDTNRQEQNAEAYFETSMDNYTYGGYGHGLKQRQMGGMGEDYHDRQARTAAVQTGGCWRPIQCHQTEAMKTFAFP
ncbi:hypothetical protein EDD11_010419 [Mortierella claussenii]|nr:hypothetical protein EDD11_010419 [Mortierella claussenii]